MALRAWIKKVSMPSLDRLEIKLLRNSSPSYSSTPIRHLTVRGIERFFFIALKQELSNLISFIKKTPKFPDLTFFDGQPTLRLISSYP